MREIGRKRSTPWTLITLTTLLTVVSLAAIGGIAYGFYSGTLVPYWQGLTDAHAAIFAQLIFFFAAAWASVLVPLLFREQLRTLEDAAATAQATYGEIQTLLEKSVKDSTIQFESITRLQLMSVGYLVDPRQLEALQRPEEKKQFVNTAWNAAKLKVDAAIALQHGNKRNAIESHTYRSNAWWDRVKSYNVLKEFHTDFKTISDKKNKQNLDLADLQAVNEATRKIQEFDPAPVQDEQVAASNPSIMMPTQLPPNGNGAAQLPQ